MGVRGLTTYVNCNQDAFLRRHYLHDTSLVIDGHSLCAQLYRLLNSFSAFGGDYDKFASYTKTFFKNLRKCKITPYILFDGSYEVRKLKTAYNRLRSKIHGASHLDPVTQSSLHIFPFLLRDVFKEVLIEMNVPYTVCEFEADEEIAVMARHLNCPVLSYDSDFFIYNVLYIPFNTIEMKPKQIHMNDEKIHVIECKIYRVEYLVKHFGGIKEELLPLLATLLGNDFVEKRVFKKFFSHLKLHKSKKKKNEQQRSIHTLFKWLQSETLESAIAKILGRLKTNQRKKVFAIITKSINGYNKTHCQSLKYFNISEGNPEVNSAIKMPENINEHYSDHEDDENGESSNDSDSCSSSDTDSDSEEMNSDDTDILPKWFAEAVRCNQIPHSYLNLYTHHLHFCSPQAEDYSDQDSFMCALPIMRYAFDLLTDFGHESFIYVSRERDCLYKRISVGKEYSISRLIETSYSKLSSEELKKCFYHFLDQKLPNIDFNSIELLPTNFQLFMISVLWWVANCSVPLSHVHSLIMTYVYLGAIDEKTGSFRGHNFFNNKYSKKLQELKKRPIESATIDELFLNRHKLQYEDCLIAAGVLLKHFEIDDSIRKRPKSYDIKKIHSFAQFQCCLQQLNSLNVMCGRPFVETVYSKCYNGTFVYNIALKLENQIEPSNYMEQYLKGATSVLKFYKSLCAIFNESSSNMNISTVIWSNRRKRSRRKKNTDGDEEIMFVVEGFESNVVI